MTDTCSALAQGIIFTVQQKLCNIFQLSSCSTGYINLTFASNCVGLVVIHMSKYSFSVETNSNWESSGRMNTVVKTTEENNYYLIARLKKKTEREHGEIQ